MCRHLEISRAAYYKWLHCEIPKDDETVENILQRYLRFLERKRSCI